MQKGNGEPCRAQLTYKRIQNTNRSTTAIKKVKISILQCIQREFCCCCLFIVMLSVCIDFDLVRFGSGNKIYNLTSKYSASSILMNRNEGFNKDHLM